MDIFFTDPDQIPLPPEKMEIRSLKAIPFPDGKRVKIEFEITPFQQRPNIEIEVFNHQKQLVSSLSVVEAIENQMTFTLHLREPEPKGKYVIKMDLFYTDLEGLDDENGPPIKDLVLENKKTMASTEAEFQI